MTSPITDAASAIEACPFCQSSSAVEHNEEFGVVHVVCSGCGAIGPFVERRLESCETQAIEKWNARGENYRLAHERTALLRKVAGMQSISAQIVPAPIDALRSALEKLQRRLGKEQRYRSDKASEPRSDRCHAEVAEFMDEMLDMIDSALSPAVGEVEG